MPDLRRVLVVDDNDTNRMLAKALLTRLGWTVDEANCGEKGLAKLAEQDYTVILLDISMPGLSGEDTCVAMRQTGKPLHIIAYTAHAFPEERAKFLAIGFDDILVKPINRQQLESIFNQF